MNTPLPTIHLNGTGKKTLCEGYDAADDALHDFIEAWERIEFNARDYYVQGSEAWTAARDARMAINAKIREIREYLIQHRAHLHQ